MAINPIGSQAAASNLQANGLGMEDFLKILLTQLTYQDPLKPMDNQEFMAQMAQFTSLQQTQQLNTNMEQLISNQAALQSVGLIGRNVQIDSNGTVLSGSVSALSLSGSAPVLTILTTGGATLNDVQLSQLLSVK